MAKIESLQSSYDIYIYRIFFPYVPKHAIFSSKPHLAETLKMSKDRSGKNNAIIIIRCDLFPFLFFSFFCRSFEAAIEAREKICEGSIDGPPWQRFFHGETNCFYAILARYSSGVLKNSREEARTNDSFERHCRDSFQASLEICTFRGKNSVFLLPLTPCVFDRAFILLLLVVAASRFFHP